MSLRLAHRRWHDIVVATSQQHGAGSMLTWRLQNMASDMFTLLHNARDASMWAAGLAINTETKELMFPVQSTGLSLIRELGGKKKLLPLVQFSASNRHVFDKLEKAGYGVVHENSSFIAFRLPGASLNDERRWPSSVDFGQWSPIIRCASIHIDSIEGHKGDNDVFDVNRNNDPVVLKIQQFQRQQFDKSLFNTKAEKVFTLCG
jgi:hypothetical protein